METYTMQTDTNPYSDWSLTRRLVALARIPQITRVAAGNLLGSHFIDIQLANRILK